MARKFSAAKKRAFKICNASLGAGRPKAKFERCVKKVAAKKPKPRRR